MRSRPSEKSAPKSKVPADNLKDSKVAKFTGTTNPREHLDRAVGCSNAPDLVLRLRHKGLAIHCENVPAIYRDSKQIRRGVFSLTEAASRNVRRWQVNREAQ